MLKIGSLDIMDLAKRFQDRWARIEFGRQNEILAYIVSGTAPTSYATMYFNLDFSQRYDGVNKW